MDKWADEVVIRLTELLRVDDQYQQTLRKCEEAGIRYLKIMERMPEEEKLEVEEYISLCEDLTYRMAQVAYYFGVGEGKAGWYHSNTEGYAGMLSDLIRL